ncbi:hypothetical protein SDRG_11709 [Saprolegnia diclina VS20]|uniref:Transmembrane protein n=1 Tax=Saprolegnia diclina (strain VS20) TaxID=1156394 RepID=T0PYM6_SAPDV|nr:hypothetical protein SDRG_11709 [Saprolegnia diclina VS20]EQC30654.1 hypothetical protein SDRG_11709 [Saprolegnia diclina VS20]|eukprot:XP_008615980.1 hypothetical protein SDRG_11709 [Saprolegnia diclina VS20]
MRTNSERASRHSWTSHMEYGSQEMPDNCDSNSYYEDFEGRPIREGGVLNIYSCENIGLIMNYVCTGWVEAILPATIYPFLTNYLNMDGYQTQAAYVLITLPYILKTVFALLSDCLPIMGRRRKPYMVIGWIISFTLIVVAIFDTQGSPYWAFGDDNLLDDPEMFRTVINANAPNEGFRYVMYMMFASFGFVMAETAGDAVMIEFAQREPANIRGTTQTMVTLAKFLSGGVGAVIVAICFNGTEYGGTFGWSLTYNQVMILAAIGPVVGFISSFFIPDQIILGDSFQDRFRDLWSAGKKRAVWQLMAFNFFNAFFFDAVAAPSDIIKRSWAQVEPFVDGVFSNVLAVFLFSLAMHFTRQCFLHTNWRMIIFVTTIVTVVIQWTVDFLCVFNVIRSQYFYMGVPLTYQIPVAIRGIVVSFATVEIADERFEASTYALISTMHAVAGPISTSIFKQIDAQFRAYKNDIATDTPAVRWEVAYCLLFCYGSRLFSNVTLFLLPRQKKEAQELRLLGDTNPHLSIFMLVLGGFALVWGVATNIMSIDPNTACMPLAGGPGC